MLGFLSASVPSYDDLSKYESLPHARESKLNQLSRPITGPGETVCALLVHYIALRPPPVDGGNDVIVLHELYDDEAAVRFPSDGALSNRHTRAVKRQSITKPKGPRAPLESSGL